ncbi:MAG: ABC transporter substrate-binding protein, partial [Janthinobacterium lividum]
MFRTSETIPTYVDPLADFVVQKLGKKRVAIVQVQTDWGQSVGETFVAQVKKDGAEIVDDSVYNHGTLDFRCILTRIRREKPDAIFLAMLEEEAARFMKPRRQLGLGDIPVVDSGVGLTGRLRADPGAGAGAERRTPADGAGRARALPVDPAAAEGTAGGSLGAAHARRGSGRAVAIPPRERPRHGFAAVGPARRSPRRQLCRDGVRGGGGIARGRWRTVPGFGAGAGCWRMDCKIAGWRQTLRWRRARGGEMAMKAGTRAAAGMRRHAGRARG